MKFYSGNYTKSNHNFVIKNLKENKQKYIFFDLLSNFYQRGIPINKSNKIVEFLKNNNLEVNNERSTLFISKEINSWHDIIKGDELNNNYPAKDFFNHIWEKELKDYLFVKNLILPEAPIKKIIPNEVKEFNEYQEVDFYIPQAKLIIEIDGYSHKFKEEEDLERDNLFYKNNITVVRISTQEIKNKTYQGQINLIKSILEKSKLIQEYKKEYIKKEINLSPYIQTSIYRFQVLLLELLSNNNQKELIIELKQDLDINYWDVALEDFLDLLNDIKSLTKENYNIPEIIIEEVNEFSNDDTIKVDFSVSKRWNDERVNNIVVRTDYFDFYNIDINNEKQKSGWENYSIDYSGLKNGDFIDYKLSNSESLKNILYRVYGYKEFNKGQINIINNSLRGNNTIGILPTGAGKSLCYQLTSLLQFGLTIVVCPIKSLIYDQLKELQAIGCTKTEYITGDVSAKDRENIYKKVVSGKIKFLIVSPERLQQKQFREDIVQRLHDEKRLSYFVIDEVHCLSEWGHDFRVSYLTLSKTISTYAPDSKLICLTATASINVLDDIKYEFEIEDQNIKFIKNFTRKELNFDVIDCDKYNSKENELKAIINKESFDNSGIVFTPFVNGDFGCYTLHNKFKSAFKDNKEQINYFSGKEPKNVKKSVFQKEKIKVQENFKKDEIKLLFATKSFGMGVNKKNVRYTVHYGIPSSIEGFYQEAGRAGRDKQKANCYVLFNRPHENTVSNLLDIKNKDKELIKFYKTIDRRERGDIENQLYLMTNENNDFEIYIRRINQVFNFLRGSKANANGEIKVSLGRDSEKLLYKLYQIGVVENWSVEDFYSGVYSVVFNNISLEDMKDNLIKLIKRYKNNIFIENHNLENITPTIYNILYYLLEWNFETFEMTRRKSLENINSLCQNFEKLGKVEFKKNIESYFKINLKENELEEYADNDNYLKILDLLLEDKEPLESSRVRDLYQQVNRYLESYYNNKSFILLSILLSTVYNVYEPKEEKLTDFLLGLEDDKDSIILLDKILNILEIYRIYYSKKYDINKLTKELTDFYDSKENIIKINNKLKDDISKMKYVKYLNSKLTDSIKEINNGFK